MGAEATFLERSMPLNDTLKLRVRQGLNLPTFTRHSGRRDSTGCAICGHRGLFPAAGPGLERAQKCEWCHAELRVRFLSELIVASYAEGQGLCLEELASTPNFQELRIFEAAASGMLHRALHHCPGYVCSEWIAGAELGDEVDGVRCEDLENLSFDEDAFDLVLHMSVLGGLRDPMRALDECHRVLRPGGLMIFEVPMTTPGTRGLRERTTERPDSQNAGAAPIYFDFGSDLVGRLDELGFDVDLHQCEAPTKSQCDAVVLVCHKRRV